MVGWEGSVIGAKGGTFGFERVGRFHAMHSSGRLHAKYGATPGEKESVLEEKGKGRREANNRRDASSVGLIEDMIERLWKLLNIGHRGKNNMNGCGGQ